MSKKTPVDPPTEVPAEEKLEEAVVDSTTEEENYREIAMRTAADFDNYRKRATREKEDAIRYANNRLLEDLLPIIDNFELGLDAAKSSPGAEAILQGLGMVRRQFQDFLTTSGLEEIKTEQVEFDPNIMEAVGYEEDEKTAEGQVLRQTRRGYKLRGRLLRPASVIVAKGPAT